MRPSLAIRMGLAFLIACPAAQAQDAEIALAEPEFHERYDEHGRVSGDIVMGVMFGPAPGAGDVLADLAPRETADVAVLRLPEAGPDAEGRRFCVRINSKDGRFEAENTYAVAGAGAAPAGPFRYGGRHAPVLRAMRAVSLVKVGRCGDRTEEVVPSLWAGGVPPTAPEALHVFVNAAGNPTVAVVGADPGFVPCDDVADPTTLKYTASCVLPVALLRAHAPGGRVPITFHVTRSLGEESFEITVILPGAGG